MNFYSDESLIQQLPGFKNNYTTVNGVNLHYVTGGQGSPLVLIPGWPQTWWSYRKIMPILAEKHSLIVVDLRGMGSSEKPLDGYTKKYMAQDIQSLITHLGHQKINIAGHDIGAAVAFSYAANFPESTDKLIILDTPHPDENIYKLPMMPIGNPVFPWWLAFNQVKQLPEELLEGRYDILQNYIFNHLLIDPETINEFDRKVYAEAYNNKAAIRSANAWYQAFTEDIQDIKQYKKITLPAIGIGSPESKEMLGYFFSTYIDNSRIEEIENSGHFVHEEKPLATALLIMDFLDH
ncbi:alpha/beta fold hydrolase [Flavobacterium notoginsengisoli]|uniref:alpha/beta fold hydrolase n=1 Tax=Flavobacterium notoginsengisoli TaxID=1478199 RepID=UPI003633052E